MQFYMCKQSIYKLSVHRAAILLCFNYYCMCASSCYAREVGICINGSRFYISHKFPKRICDQRHSGRLTADSNLQLNCSTDSAGHRAAESSVQTVHLRAFGLLLTVNYTTDTWGGCRQGPACPNAQLIDCQGASADSGLKTEGR